MTSVTGDDIAIKNKQTRVILRHLLKDPGDLTDKTWAFTDLHPTVCGRYRFGDALPQGDYSAHRMCGVCQGVSDGTFRLMRLSPLRVHPDLCGQEGSVT